MGEKLTPTEIKKLAEKSPEAGQAYDEVSRNKAGIEQKPKSRHTSTGVEYDLGAEKGKEALLAGIRGDEPLEPETIKGMPEGDEPIFSEEEVDKAKAIQEARKKIEEIPIVKGAPEIPPPPSQNESPETRV